MGNQIIFPLLPESLVGKDKTEEDCRSAEMEQNNKARENGTDAELGSKSSNVNKKRKTWLELEAPPRRSQRAVMTTLGDSKSSIPQDNNSEIVEHCSRVEGESKTEELAETPEDGSTQLARIPENKAILASLGLGNSIRMLENLVFPPKTTQNEAKDEEEPKIDNQVTKKSDYESIRNARISENKARLEALGVTRSLREMQTVMSPKTSTKSKSKSGNAKKAKTEVSVPSRRSNRLKRTKTEVSAPSRRSNRLKRTNSSSALSYESDESDEELVDIMDRKKYPISERCAREARGSISDPVIGIYCHFCRKKTLCGEEDCKHCRDRDINQPCIGKTECSVCHSWKGILCRACLKHRYGEEMEEVRSKGDWMCPHCIEKKGINPYWVCNSSSCLKRRKIVPTGIAFHQARAEGFPSVAHMIMDKLKQKAMVL